VLLIDRSRPMTTAELRGDHLRGKRMQRHDVVAGAGPGSPRVFQFADGSTQLLPGDGDGGEYGLVAMTLGGGTRLWQGMSWRFYAEDFRMASTYGVPLGSTLIDWPFGYDELAPYYDRVESELGVAGDGASPMARRTLRSGPYPMPPMPSDDVRARFAAAARDLGWSTSPIPFAINSVPRDGRPACIRCAQCIGHACPVDAKNGTHNTFIPRALATGNCDLLLSAQALAIEQDAPGVASGVRIVVDSESGPVERFVRARQIVVAAGAIESPRLLLASGLGNGWVGRNHHNHGIAGATALSGATRRSFEGPGHSVATVDWVHRDGLAWGGGVIFDAAPLYPLQRARLGRQLPGLAWGQGHKSWMRSSGPLLGTRAMVQEIPDASARVTLDPRVVDRWGMPAPRITGSANRATRQAAGFLVQRCVEWLEAAGGRDIQTLRADNEPQGAEHSAGTVRLADDPVRGACDPQGLLFGTRNVYVADASLHPTNGGFNPGLTVMANALRVADLMN
jgi:choline dehydrogenase-like flavoprotein